jgi:Na+-driven multidrug efflux pump
MLIVIPGQTWLAAVFGTGDTRVGSAIELTGSVLMLASAYVMALVLGLGLTYAWATLGLMGALSFSMSYIRLRTGRWMAHEL